MRIFLSLCRTASYSTPPFEQPTWQDICGLLARSDAALQRCDVNVPDT
jgi:hypothetical protein